MSLTTAVSSRLPMPINVTVSPQQWRVLTDAIFPTAKTAESVMLALEYCRARNLDPFKRPVHIVPMWSTTLKRQVETVWPGINELQVTASRSNAWAGMDEPQFGPDHEYTFVGMSKGYNEDAREVTIKVTAPEWCSIRVWKIVNGQKCSFAGEPVFWLEAYARLGRDSDLPNEMWRKRPRGQLMKCAKAASLRAAFPEDLGGTYAAEEMEDRETDSTGAGPVIDAKAEVHTHVSDVRAEEESEFVIRADATLTEAAARSPTAWLKAFIGVMGECPTMSDHAAICSWPSVQEAQAKAPTLIRTQLSDAIKAAEVRIAAPPAEAKADPAPEFDPLTALLMALNAISSDAAVVAWRISPDTKAAIGKLQEADRQRLEDAIAGHRGTLNDPGAAE